MKKAFKISAVVLALVALVALSVVFAVNAEPIEINQSNYQTAMEAGGEFKLTADVSDGTTAAVIRIGENVTLDLNGHTITSTYGEGLFYQVKASTGTFKIIDSAGGGAILAPEANLVDNNIRGNVSVEGGTLVVKALLGEGGTAKVTLKGSGEDDPKHNATQNGDVWTSKDTKGTWVSLDISNPQNDYCVDGYHGIKQSNAKYPRATYRVVPQDYTITYSFVGNDGKTVTNKNVEIYDIESPMISLSAAELKGYEFLGWWIYENGSYAQISSIYPQTRLYDLKIEGRFEPQVYNINYVWEGNVTNAATNPATFTNGTATITLADPTKVGAKTFLGWYDAATGGNKVETIDCANTYNDVTLYARFDMEVYDITYELNGGTVDPANPATYTADDEIVFNDAVKPGYNFEGWYDAATEGNKVEKISVGTTGDITLYARFSLATYNITYDFGDVTVNNEDEFPKTYTIEDDTITLPTPAVDEGTEFVKWVDENGNEIEVIETGSYGDKTIKAVWNNTQYKLFYNFGIGVDISDVDNSANTVEYFDKYTEVILNPAKRAYFTFDGWYDKDPTTSSDAKKIEKIKKGTTGNVTVYAKWTPIDYTIEYDEQGYMIVIDPDTQQETKVPFTEGATLPADAITTYNYATSVTLPVPTREGYAFVGWYDTVTGTTITKIDAGTRDGDITGDNKLVAVWEIGSWKVNIRYIYNKDYQAAKGLSDEDCVFWSNEQDIYVVYGEEYTHDVDFTAWNGFIPEAWSVTVTGLAQDQTIDIYFEPVVRSTVYENGQLVVTYYDGTTSTVEMNSLSSVKLNGSQLVYVTADGEEVVVASIVTTEALTDQVETLNKALSDLDAAYKAADSTLQKNIDDLKKQLTDSLADLQSQIDANKDSIKANADAITSLTSLIETLQGQVDSLDGTDTGLLVAIIIIGVIAVASAAAVVVLFVKKK